MSTVQPRAQPVDLAKSAKRLMMPVEQISMVQKQLTIQTHGRSTTEITERVRAIVTDSAVQTGICHLFLHHTSASLMLCENADPSVRGDLERFFSRLVKDGDPIFEHTSEGIDDMAAHIRSVLTLSSLSVPITDGHCALGTWQGIYLWEHRHHAHRRKVTITVMGTTA